MKEWKNDDLECIKKELFFLVEGAVSSREKVYSGDNSDLALFNFLEKYGKMSDEFKLNPKAIRYR